MTRSQRIALLCLAGLPALLAGCGGSSGDSTPAASTPAAATPAAGTPAAASSGLSSASQAGQCAAANPYASNPGSGTLDTEKGWVAAYMREQYLWYSQIPAVNAADAAFSNASQVYPSLKAYFTALKTPAKTPSGKPVDQFSFTYPTAQWKSMIQSGVSVSYGFEPIMVSPTVPRVVRVAYVEPGSPAAAAGVLRGDSIRAVSVDGGPAVGIDTNDQAGIDVLNQALFPETDGQKVAFQVLSNDGTTKTLAMAATQVTSQPLMAAKTFTAAGGQTAGYLLYNQFAALGESQMVDAVTQMKARGVTDVVLDLRYNGGGYLYLASQIAYMLGGPARTKGQVFEKLQYNDWIDPTVPDSEKVTPFYATTSGQQGSGTASGTALPSLSLSRLYVLTSHATCSASESVINSLRGVNLPVTVIGDTTCGKPYGFEAADNCGISYFPIQFKGVNAKGYGDYADGFAANVSVADDLNHPLGDPSEAMLATALSCIAGTTSCAASTSVQPKSVAQAAHPSVSLPPWRSSKFLR